MENKIRALRSEMGLSQEELARRCGVSRQTINAIENNKYDPASPWPSTWPECWGPRWTSCSWGRGKNPAEIGGDPFTKWVPAVKLVLEKTLSGTDGRRGK